MIFAAPRLGQDFLANQQAEFDADAGKADALTSYFGACRDIVKTREFPALHARPVVQRR